MFFPESSRVEKKKQFVVMCSHLQQLAWSEYCIELKQNQEMCLFVYNTKYSFVSLLLVDFKHHLLHSYKIKLQMLLMAPLRLWFLCWLIFMFFATIFSLVLKSNWFVQLIDLQAAFVPNWHWDKAWWLLSFKGLPPSLPFNSKNWFVPSPWSRCSQ